MKEERRETCKCIDSWKRRGKREEEINGESERYRRGEGKRRGINDEGRAANFDCWRGRNDKKEENEQERWRQMERATERCKGGEER